jgi:thiol-disulfide isomerase/thioredoxin
MHQGPKEAAPEQFREPLSRPAPPPRTGRVRDLGLGICLLALAGAPLPSVGEPRIAPDWTLETPEGRPVQLADVAEKQTTLLFFWATWCPYCKALMPHLQSMRLEHGDELRILAVNIFEDGDPVEFIRSAGYDFTLLLAGDDVAGMYSINGTPGVLIVDRNRAVEFDLRQVRRPASMAALESASNSRKAASLAPYWAAEIRKAIDATRRHVAE